IRDLIVTGVQTCALPISAAGDGLFLAPPVIEIDLSQSSVRELNQRLHRLGPGNTELYWRVVNPGGTHAIAVGLTAPVHVGIDGRSEEGRVGKRGGVVGGS